MFTSTSVPRRVLVALALATLACSTLIPGTPIGLPSVASPTAVIAQASPSATRLARPTGSPTPAASATTRPTATPRATSTSTRPPATPTPSPTIITSIKEPYQIRGRFTVTNDFVLATYYVEHAVALTDMHGFIIRDEEWEIPLASQVLGFMQVDLETLSGTFDLNLPLRPEGTFNDVDNDSQTDTGVQVFAVAYSPNLTGGPYSEGDDRSFGWPAYLASVKTDAENNDEVTGGKLVVWAPDDQQQFPSGFGPDGLLFTPDDPVAPLPAGYAVIDLDQTPFAVSQEPSPELELYEPADIAVKDFSDQTYTQAFESLYQALSTEWAFNGIASKRVDWTALYNRIRPRVVEAERNRDAAAFFQALFDFTHAIPDGHVGLNGGAFEDQAFQERTEGGYGFAIRELENGDYVVVYITPDGPAEAAGLRVGAKVTQFNGQPITRAISEVVPFGGPFSQDLFRRYQQARYLLRAPLGTEATVTFINPNASTPKTVTLETVAERESFSVTSIYFGYQPPQLPVTYDFLASGVGYIQISSYFDDLNLVIRLFERALKTFEANGISRLIIDLRYNSGGAPLGLAGFLTDQIIPLGQDESYSEKTGRFEPSGPQDKILPNKTRYGFERIAVLVGPACFSACEAEAYGFSQVPGAIVVGYYPSAGVYANVAGGQVELPEGMSLQYSAERTVKPDGSLFLEGTGVPPTVKVPLTLDNLLSDEDVVLRTAEEALTNGAAPASSEPNALQFGSAQEAEQALESGASFLEDMAQEEYAAEELSQPGRVYTYTVQLQRDEALIWANGWCATTPEILAENFESIRVTFSANGEPLEEDELAVFEGQAGDLYCRLLYTVVTAWPTGETRLENQVTFSKAINDGQADFAAGTHTYVYMVTKP